MSDPVYVQAVALSYGEDDASNNRERAKRGEFVELFDVDANRAQALMQSADLDVIVDLMTHTRGARLELASESVAPSGSSLMVSYLGYPGVAGGVHWDYTLADSIVLPPEHAKGIEEPLIYLPFSYQANDYAPSSPAILEQDLVPQKYIRYCNINPGR